ncbi:hypothetical protein HNQ69_001122 [Bartonella callosciuri]|uniref:BepF protein n=1 Tax=Bartonella callosciuri TaxID=686223 RepID=A0A840NXL2_9HYPH|nr:BID domain-containing T4SS effector [Bartonella callosciuri]MBB5073989.1 hypothetical protein [Bartonella callosciuri]
MKKRQPSPFIAQMMEKFERSHEESTTTPINPRSAPKTQAPPLPQGAEKFVEERAPLQQTPHVSDEELSNITAQESQTPSVKVAPPKPPRTKAKAPSSQTTQESQPQSMRVAPQRPPRARDKELSSQAIQESQTPSIKVVPPEPPHTQTKAPSSPTTQESGVVYAEVVIQTPQQPKDRQQSDRAAQEDKTIYATVVPQRVSSSLSKEEIILRVRNNMFVQACKDEIESLSQAVYGKPDIFQKKLEEIEKNPFLGESLSLQVAANPKFIAPLVGKKVLGIKSQARKQAEENVSPLCLALENYAETVKQAKESILHGHRAKQTRHRESMDLTQMAESLQKPRQPEQERAPLSQKEIARRVKSNTAVQYCQAEIIYWCTIAYNDPRILQYRLEEIQKSPEMGEELAWQVTTHPRLFGKLAGYNIHGFKNKARKEAESALTRLGEAIEGYAEAVKQAEENIVQTHQENQRRQAQQPGELDKNLQQQQRLSQSPKPAERLAETVHHQTSSETSRQAERQPVDVQPKKVAALKAMALTG